MTSHQGMPDRQRTAATMHDTAEELEGTEAILHRSAEESPDPVVRARLHALGDRVTRQARLIDERADRLTEPEANSERGGSLAGQ